MHFLCNLLIISTIYFYIFYVQPKQKERKSGKWPLGRNEAQLLYYNIYI